MDVRCHSDSEAARVSKNAHKESREIKGAEGSLPAAFLKEPQGAFSASGASEDCNKSKSNSSADPDYCRRILVRGRDGQGFGARSFGHNSPVAVSHRRLGLARTWEKVVVGPLFLGSGRPRGPVPGAPLKALSRSLGPSSPEGPLSTATGRNPGAVDQQAGARTQLLRGDMRATSGLQASAPWRAEHTRWSTERGPVASGHRPAPTS